MPNVFPPQLWEIHPMLVHFPIAFLLAGVIVDVYGWWRGDPRLVRLATSLLIVGVLADILAAATGFVAFLQFPPIPKRRIPGCYGTSGFNRLCSLPL